MSHTSGAYRALEIILGIVAIAIGILALVFPAGVIITIAVLFGIALFIIGILRLATSFSSGHSGSVRAANAVIGVIAIILGLLIIFFPTFAGLTLIILLGIGLFIYGIGRLAVGSIATNLPGGLRALVIIFGILVAIFGLLIIFVPAVGVFTTAFFFSIAFILIGIDSLAAGATGTRVT